MSVTLISQLKQKNNGTFPLIDANDLLGGYYQVATQLERDEIPNERRKIGMFCYVEADDITYKWTGTTWEEFQSGSGDSEGGNVLIQSTTPDSTDNDKLWVNPAGNLTSAETTAITALTAAYSALVARLETLEYLRNKIDCGTTVNSSNTVYAGLTGVEPEVTQTWETIDETGGAEPEESEPNVNHFCPKRDTLTNFNNYSAVDGELVYVTDKKYLMIYQNSAWVIIASSSTPTPDDDDLTGILEKLQFSAATLGTDGTWTVSSTLTYVVRVNADGEFVISNSTIEDTTKIQSLEDGLTASSQRLRGLTISMVYAGGTSSTTSSYMPCSHNFVELYNNTDTQINMRGLCLWFSNTDGVAWTRIPLYGLLPVHRCFLIRGAACSDVLANTTVLNIDKYDVDNSTLKLDQTKYKIFLGYDPTLYSSTLVASVNGTITSPWDYTATTPAPAMVNSVGIGYIDFVGAGATKTDMISCEMATTAGSCVININSQRGIYRSFLADTVKNSEGAYDDTNVNATDYKLIDYWENPNNENNVDMYMPYCVKDGEKDMFFNKHKYSTTKPAWVSQSYGINPNTTRCFSWISVGYYNEYLQYRVQGTTTWTQVESINISDETVRTTYNALTNQYPLLYACYSRVRKRAYDGTRYTGHKVIIGPQFAGYYGSTIANSITVTSANTSPVIYEYRVGREGCWSDTYTFKMKYFDKTTSARALQVTDQQGWDFWEYEPWRVSAEAIKAKLDEDLAAGRESDYDFIMNTGDFSQNGCRPNEWVDYFEPVRSWMPNYPTMCVIGNNDLGPATEAETTGKINPDLFSIYFCYEYPNGNIPFIDINYLYGVNASGYSVPVYTTDNSSATYMAASKYINKLLMRSVYYFDLGCTRFIGINAQRYIGYIEPGSSGVTEGIGKLGGDVTVYNTWLAAPNSETYTNFVDGSQFSWIYGVLDDANENTNILFKTIITHDCPVSIATDLQIKTGSAYAARICRLNRDGWAETVTSGVRAGWDGDYKDNYASCAHSDSNKYAFNRQTAARGVNLFIGGHKHTYSRSYPTLETEITYTDGANYVVKDSTTPTFNYSCRPRVLKTGCTKELVPTTGVNFSTAPTGTLYTSDFDEYVSPLAPVHFTLNATGYKLQSNKEQPPSTGIVVATNTAYGVTYDCNWMSKVFYTASESAKACNMNQYFPMYADWSFGYQAATESEQEKAVVNSHTYRILNAMVPLVSTTKTFNTYSCAVQPSLTTLKAKFPDTYKLSDGTTKIFSYTNATGDWVDTGVLNTAGATIKQLYRPKTGYTMLHKFDNMTITTEKKTSFSIDPIVYTV